MQTYQNWRLEEDKDKILWLYFDRKDSAVNSINMEVMQELSSILDSFKNDAKHRGLIIASAKTTGFIAGADISQFSQFKDIAEGVNLLRQGQLIFDKLEDLGMPTVAMIEGFCLGGGTELSLACRYRVAEDSPKTKIGLPEVKLGIHPGWGGTVRLPRLIGIPQAMNLILSGHLLSAKAAAKLGVVDAAVPKRHLVEAAKYYIIKQPRQHHATFLQQLLNKPILRKLFAGYLRKKLREKISPSHYPAPFEVVNNWERFGLGNSAFAREAKTCGKLFFSDTSRNLVRVFYLQDRLKSLGKGNKFSPRHVHVIGAGTMGGDIAAWCAFQGFEVTLQDREAKFIAPAIKRAHALFKDKLKEHYLIQRVMDRLMPDEDGHGIKKADVIIEAIYEDLAAKQKLFKILEAQAKPDAILATNTSSIPLDEINSVLTHPERLVGIHFFNPVAKMMLVEVVQGKKTDTTVLENAIGFVRKLDRLPLPVKSSPGFLVNRILMPYLMESMNMLNEGIPAWAIDKAMLNFGMPMGPITLADVVGLDICLSVAQHLGQYYKQPVPDKLIKMVADGRLGKKSGKGFYQWTKSGKQIKSKEKSYHKSLLEISDRLVAKMVNESEACLKEGVVADGDLLDAGMIFGTGFAPFRGGPIHYAKELDKK